MSLVFQLSFLLQDYSTSGVFIKHHWSCRKEESCKFWNGSLLVPILINILEHIKSKHVDSSWSHQWPKFSSLPVFALSIVARMCEASSVAFYDFGQWTGDSVGCQAGVSPCCDSPSFSEEGGLYFLSSRRSSEVALFRGCCPGCRSQRPGKQFRSA